MDESSEAGTGPHRASPPARGQYLLGLDVGSTTVRAVIFDLQGAPVAEAYREPPIHHPQPDQAEVDAEDWWRCAVQVIREALAWSGISPASILAVGLCGLLHALVPIDPAGRPLARAMLWMDRRCRPQAQWLARQHRRLIEAAGGPSPMSTTWSAPKLRWIAEHDPSLLQRTHLFLPAKDYCRLRLTGTIATDPSDAHGTALLDHPSGEWSQPLLEAVGVPLQKLPPIRDSAAVAGTVTPQAARSTGLLAGTPAVVGGGDTMCTRLGAGALDTGRACLYLGTAAWISVPGPRAATFSATATTGATLKWLRSLLAPEAGYASLLREAAEAAPGANGLVFLPHLMGERGPRDDPEARGVLFGLTLAHGRPEIVRAALEGCACQLRAIVEALSARPIEEMVVVGGGARSPLWRGIIADVMGVDLLVPRVLEAGALGAAILAGVGVGVYPSLRQATAEVVRIVERRAPDPTAHSVYDRVYRAYLALEERIAPLYNSVPSVDTGG